MKNTTTTQEIIYLVQERTHMHLSCFIRCISQGKPIIIVMLFMYYNIKKYILDIHSSDAIDKIRFNDNDFKTSMQRYSDTFDYDTLCLQYEELTAAQINE